jgi:hypothetical protein
VRARCERTAVQRGWVTFHEMAEFASVMPILSVRVRWGRVIRRVCKPEVTGSIPVRSINRRKRPLLLSLPTRARFDSAFEARAIAEKRADCRKAARRLDRPGFIPASRVQASIRRENQPAPRFCRACIPLSSRMPMRREVAARRYTGARHAVTLSITASGIASSSSPARVWATGAAGSRCGASAASCSARSPRPAPSASDVGGHSLVSVRQLSLRRPRCEDAACAAR